MSSLRLALMRSLEDCGQHAKQNKEKERRQKQGKSRRGRKREQTHGPKKRGPGRPRKNDPSSFQSPHRQHESSSGSSDGGAGYSDADGGSSSENEFSGSSDNDTNQASVDVEETASALFKDSDDSGSDENDSAMQRKKMRKKKKRSMKKHRNSAANRIQNHWKKKKGKAEGSTGETPSVRKKKHNDVQASSQKAKAPARKTKALTVPPPASNIVSWVEQLSVEMQRTHITAGQRVKVRFEINKRRDGKLIRRRKWYGGLVTGVSTGGSKIRIKYDDGTSEVSKFPDNDIVVDAVGNGRHRVSAERFLPPPSEREETTSPQPRYQSPSTNDDNSEPRERIRIKKEPSRETAASPKSSRLKLSIPKGQLKDDRSQSPDTEASAPLPSPEIPPSRKTPPPETGGVSLSQSHGSTESSGSSHFRSAADSQGQSAEQTETPAERPRVILVKSEEGQKDYQEDSLSRVPSNDSTLEQNMTQTGGAVEKKPAAPTKRNLTIRLIPPKATKETTRESDDSHTDDQVLDDDDDQSSDEEMSVDHSDDAGDSPTNANAVVIGNKARHENSEGTTAKSDVVLGPAERVPGTKKTVFEKPQDSPLAGKKRASVDVVDASDEPAAKRHSGEDKDNERKGAPLPSSEPLTSNQANDTAASAASPLERDSAVTSDTEVVRSTSVEKPVGRVNHGTSPSSSQHRDSSSNLGDSPAESLLSQSSTKHNKRDDGQVQEDSSSPSSHPMHQSAGAHSPRGAGSPTHLSADPKHSTDEGVLSKPVSTLATAVKLDASESGDREVPVLTGSRNSAFYRKESTASNESGGQMKPSSVAASGSDEESVGRSTTPLPPDHGDGSKGTSIPVARSGRRAAQQANQRIAARQEIVIQDPFAKKKKKRDKHGFKTFPRKRKHHSNERDDDEDDDSHWVQCDHCSKWRILPSTVETDKLPKHWYCEMNVYDAARNSCDAPEQTAEEIKSAKRKKRGKKERRARAETPTDALETSEERKDGFSSNEVPTKELGISAIEKDEEIRESETRPSGESPPKPKRSSPATTASPGVPESPKPDYDSAPQKADTAKVKKSKTNQTSEGNTSAANDESGGEISAPKKRGRKRTKDAAGKENEKGKGGKGGSKGGKEADNQEWVQCEKCEKWRRLPPHISAEDLPEVWYCNMNTWDPTAASCNADEEKADPNTREYNIFGSGQSSYGSSGKLSYRNLLFGTGRKQNRPISERTRAAESLFSSLSQENSEGNGHPTVMYAKSSAFVPRKSHSFLDESGKMSFFDLMSHSNLWAELRGGSSNSPAIANGRVRSQKSAQSFEELPKETKHALKELVHHALGTGVLAGHEVLLEAQCRQWENTPQHWEELRALFTLDVVTSLLFELVTDGLVEFVRENAQQSLVENLPRYRRVDRASGEAANSSRRSRCMKISKPWKRAGPDVSNQWCI